MTRKIIFSCLFMLGVFCPLPSMAAIYTGGNGSGWSYSAGNFDMYYGGIGDGYSLLAGSAASACASGGTSPTVGRGCAAKLGFTTNPSTPTFATVAFSTQPVVAVQDSNGNTVPVASDSITLAVSGGTGSLAGGTNPVSASSGVATFSNLNITTAGTYAFNPTDTLSPPLTAASNPSVTINNGISLVHPNGGENIPESVNYTTSWNSYGLSSSDTYTVQYQINGGAWTTPTGGASVPGSGTNPITYNWLPPPTSSSNVLWKVTDNNNSCALCTATSAAAFSLVASIALTQPAATTTWVEGFAHSVVWTNVGSISNVKLEYSTSSSGPWTTFSPTGGVVVPSGNQTSGYNYSWTPSSSLAGGTYYIRASDYNNSSVTYTVSPSFTIQSLALTAPTSGQRIQAGSNTNITWTSGGISNVSIQYTTNGTTWTTIASPVSAAGGTYTWAVPSNFTTSNNVQIKVSSTAADSDADTAASTSSAFTIYGVLTGTGITSATSWAQGTSQTINYTISNGNIANVKLEYSTDGTNYNLITSTAPGGTNTGGDGFGHYSTTWTPTITGGTVTIRESDANDVNSNSYSNTTPQQDSYITPAFTITGMAITSPTATSTWNCGSSQTITWTTYPSGSIAQVNISYSTNGGTSWTAITTALANGGTYTWTSVELTPSNQAQIKVQGVSPTTSATSPNFNIAAVITAPVVNSGAAVYVGTSYPITWTNTGTVTNVSLQYSTNSGGSWTAIPSATNILNSGSFSWTVPDAINNNNTLLKVIDADSGVPASSAQTATASAFSIQSNMAVTSPASAASWAVNDLAKTITWTYTGTVSKVNLLYSTNSGSTWTTISNISNTGSYLWTSMPDLVAAVLANPQASQNPSVAVQIKVQDADASSPQNYSSAISFNAIYYTTTWNVLDGSGSGSLMSQLGVSENDSPAWTASSGTSGLTSNSQTWHNDPYGTYTTTWYANAGQYTANPYSNATKSGWLANQNQTISISMFLASSAATPPVPYSDFTYDATSNIYTMNAWLQKTGQNVLPTSATVPFNNPTTITIVDANNNNVGSLSASASTTTTSSFNATNGVFRMTWTPPNVSSRYLGTITIYYNGTPYSLNTVYSVSTASLGTVPGAVATLQTTANTISSNVTTLQTTANTISSGVNLLSGLPGNVATLQTTANTISTNTAGLSGLPGQMTTLQSTANTISSNVYALSAVPAEMTTLQSTDNTISSSVFALSGLPGNMTTLQSTANTISSNVFALSGLPGNMTTLQTTANTISSNTAGLSVLPGEVSGLVTTANTISSSVFALSGLPASMITLQSTANTISSNVNGLSVLPGEISGLVTTANTISSNVYALSAVPGEMTSLQTTANTISSNVNGLSVLPGEISGLVTTANGISSNVAGLSVLPGEVSGLMITDNGMLSAVNGLSGLPGQVSGLVTTANTISSNVYTLSALPGQVSGLVTTANTISSNVTGLSALPGEVNGLVTTDNGVLSAMNSLNGLPASMIALQSTANGISSNVNGLSATVNTLSGLGTTITGLQKQLTTLTPTMNNLNALVGAPSDGAGANSIFGKIASINNNITPLVNNWGTVTPQTLANSINSTATNLGNPTDPCGVLSIFGKINCVYNQGGDVTAVSALANQTFGLIQQVQQQIGTAPTDDSTSPPTSVYNMLQTLTDYMNQMKSSAVAIPQSTLAQLSQGVQAAQQKLQTTASGMGIVGVSLNSAPPSTVTLDNLHQQLVQLQQMTEAVKNTVQSKEVPNVKAWFENGASNQ